MKWNHTNSQRLSLRQKIIQYYSGKEEKRKKKSSSTQHPSRLARTVYLTVLHYWSNGWTPVFSIRRYYSPRTSDLGARERPEPPRPQLLYVPSCPVITALTVNTTCVLPWQPRKLAAHRNGFNTASSTGRTRFDYHQFEKVLKDV